MLKVGDKIIFQQNSIIDYQWKLNENEIYIIDSVALDHMKIERVYGVSNLTNTIHSTWYHERDLITVKEIRKQKLKKLNEQH